MTYKEADIIEGLRKAVVYQYEFAKNKKGQIRIKYKSSTMKTDSNTSISEIIK